MKLTASQLQSLRLAQQWRQTGVSVPMQLRASRKGYLYLFGLAALAGTAYWWIGIPEAAWVVAGMVLGCVLRDLRLFRLQARMWPVNVAITDWQRVDALIAENSDS